MKLPLPILLLFMIILSGAGCTNPVSSPSSSSSTSPTSILSSQENSIEPFLATTTRTFSDPETVISFRYPSTWTYQQFKHPLIEIESPQARMWEFYYQGKSIMSADAPSYDPGAFSGCQGHFLEEKVYSTNDSRTTVVEQICGRCLNEDENVPENQKPCAMEKKPYGANIYLLPGRKLSKLSDLWTKYQKDYSNIYLLTIPSPFADSPHDFSDIEYTRFIEQARHIAKSITITNQKNHTTIPLSEQEVDELKKLRDALQFSPTDWFTHPQAEFTFQYSKALTSTEDTAFHDRNSSSHHWIFSHQNLPIFSLTTKAPNPLSVCSSLSSSQQLFIPQRKIFNGGYHNPDISTVYEECTACEIRGPNDGGALCRKLADAPTMIMVYPLLENAATVPFVAELQIPKEGFTHRYGLYKAELFRLGSTITTRKR